MHSLRSLLRMPLLQISSGEQIAEVQEIVLDINQALVYGVKVLETKAIRLTDLVIGRDAVMIYDQNVVADIRQIFPETVMLSIQLFDKEIYTDMGLCLGILADIQYNCKTGEIKSYEVSDSLLGDFINGRKFMPFPSVQVVGQNRIIVPHAMSELLSAAPKFLL